MSYSGPDRRTSDFGLRDYLEAKFTDIERRLERIEQAGPRAGAFGALGALLGGFAVGLTSFLRPR